MGIQFTKQHIPLVMSGAKTQTRRPFIVGDVLMHVPLRVKRKTRAGHRLHWQVNHPYAIQPGRAQRAVGTLIIDAIRLEDVRDISAEDAKAEGYDTPLHYLSVWAGFWDKAVHLTALPGGRWHLTIETPRRSVRSYAGHISIGKAVIEVTGSAAEILEELKRWRPERLYKAWALTFHVVRESQEVQA